MLNYAQNNRNSAASTIWGRSGASGGVRVGAAQMQGRRDYLEDTYSFHPGTSVLDAWSAKTPSAPVPTIIGCYDGHGGSQTSKLLAAEFPLRLQSLIHPLDSQALCAAFLDFDRFCLWHEYREVHKRQQQQPQRQSSDVGWGSTCVVAVLLPVPGTRNWQCAVAHVGDSRAYLLRDGGKFGQVLTRDHKPSLTGEHQRIQSANGFVTQDRVDGNLNMSRAFADGTYKRNPHLSPFAQKVIAVPDVAHLELRPGDRLLLCSDGLAETLSHDQIVDHWNSSSHQAQHTSGHSPYRAVTAVAADLVQTAFRTGSSDNITAVIIEITDHPHAFQPMESWVLQAAAE